MNLKKFKYFSAQNFFCFGPEGVEVDLTKYGNIVLIKGQNLDVVDAEEKVASNGSGKTSLMSIIVYTLFGRTINKNIGHANIINNQSVKKLRTEVRWDDYRVVRTRKPDSLQLWQSKDGIWNEDTEITASGMPATQKEIEKLLGLDYETFVNTVVFTDNNSGSFLECDTPTKRQIVENLLSLEKYRKCHDVAKKFKNATKSELTKLADDYQGSLNEISKAEEQVKKVKFNETEWRKNKSNELSNLIAGFKKTQTELTSTDEGIALNQYREAQEIIEKHNLQIIDLESKKDGLKQSLDLARDKLEKYTTEKNNLSVGVQECKLTVNSINSEISNCQKAINKVKSKQPGTVCSECFGIVAEENGAAYLQQNENKLQHFNSELNTINTKLKAVNDELTAKTKAVSTLNETISAGDNKLKSYNNDITKLHSEIARLSKISKPESGTQQKLIEQHLEDLKKQILAKEDELNGPSPFGELLTSAEKDVLDRKDISEKKKAHLLSLEGWLPYFEFWVSGFGDSGIRKLVIDGIVPSLNNRIAYWLQYLIDCKISLKFDNELEETIERNPPDGNPFVYHAMSGGQRRRLNLAVSQAFSYIMMMSCGTCPNIVFLDEVSSNIDSIGMQGIYNMILELSKERQVFITTHDEGLLSLLDGCEKINLKMKNGFTKIS